MADHPDILVFSHLRWNFVWQRPQHLLSRFAANRRVFFIEEPSHVPNAAPHWNCSNPNPGVTVCEPRTPGMTHGYDGEQLAYLADLLPGLLRDVNLDDYIVWFYTPMAIPLLNKLQPRAVIYDCMDELSAFRGAPPHMLEREAELLRRADRVFTGGPSLYRAKKDRHPQVHCFPSSVDVAHFGKAKDSVADHAEQAQLPRPRFGFFGVIDERFDVPLLAEVAQARPDWHFSMVGPVVKIDPNTLPRQANIHYFGQRSYEELPAFLAGWDVCLLPFARNESTRFISPTKTLEYMAAERPIVSTPITDVANPYGDIVYLADTATDFVAACERALNADAAERDERFAKMRKVLQRTSWDSTVQAMDELLDRTVSTRKQAEWQSSTSASSPASTPPVVVIGAGPTGLSAAYHLGEDALLLEQNDVIGGWCRSMEVNGFTFDCAGHIMFTNDAYVKEMYRLLLGDNVHWQNREAWIYSKNVYTRYPFQGALYGLPPAVIKECIIGAIESRFGSVRSQPAKTSTNGALTNGATSNGASTNGASTNGASTNGASTNGASTNGASTNSNSTNGKSECNTQVNDCCADGILESTARLGKGTANGSANGSSNGHATAENFEDFIYRVWGAGIAKHFAIPYNRKLWAVPLTEMETSWLGGRVPLPDLEEMIEGALKPVPSPMGPNAIFGYPLRGGFQALMDGFLPHLQGRLQLNARVAGVSPSRHTITMQDGTEIPYEQLISTMPLPTLIRLAGNEVPEEVRQAAAGLRNVSVRCVHIGVGRPALTEKHWIYYPEDTVFHRIFVQGNASPHCNPPGGFGLTCEITYHAQYKPLPVDGDALIQRCIEDCIRVGIFNREDPIWATAQFDLPHAYVVYDHARLKNVALLRAWLEQHDIILAGRYSEWEYYNSDHAFLAGKKAADKVRSRLQAATV